MTASTPTDLLLGFDRTPQPFEIGDWQFELRGADVDDIKFAGETVLRSIRFAVRDHDWRTVPNLSATVEPGADGNLRVVGRASDGSADIRWQIGVSIEADALTVAVSAEVLAPFARARIGLVVLHPPQLAGVPLGVAHSDGTVEQTAFPLAISPHQPAFDIAGLAWQTGAVESRVDFSGDVFEMEDQRNWTDASFKTYSTPLALPFPVQVEVDETIEQSVRVQCALVPGGEKKSDAGTEPIRVVIGDALGMTLPEVTTSAATARDGDSPDGVAPGGVAPDRVAPVQVPAGPPRPGTAPRSAASALLLELDPTWPNWRAALTRALADAVTRPLDLRLIVADPDEIEPMLAEVASRDAPDPIRLGVYGRTGHLSEHVLIAELSASAQAHGFRSEIVAGTRAHFTELNRGAHELAGWRRPLTFSVIPFMHDVSGHQLVESIEMQRRVVMDATSIALGRPLHIGPITLRARFNAVATGPADAASAESAAVADVADGYGPELTPGATDERQGAESLAAWLLASVEALAIPGVESLSYFEEWGPRGLVARNGVTAAGTVFEWIASLAGGQMLAAEASAPVAVLAVGDGTGITVLVGNLSGESVDIELELADAIIVSVESTGALPPDPKRLAPGQVMWLRYATGVCTTD